MAPTARTALTVLRVRRVLRVRPVRLVPRVLRVPMARTVLTGPTARTASTVLPVRPALRVRPVRLAPRVLRVLMARTAQPAPTVRPVLPVPLVLPERTVRQVRKESRVRLVPRVSKAFRVRLVQPDHPSTTVDCVGRGGNASPALGELHRLDCFDGDLSRSVLPKLVGGGATIDDTEANARLRVIDVAVPNVTSGTPTGWTARPCSWQQHRRTAIAPRSRRTAIWRAS